MEPFVVPSIHPPQDSRPSLKIYPVRLGQLEDYIFELRASNGFVLTVFITRISIRRIYLARSVNNRIEISITRM